EPGFARLVGEWETRLAPLAEATAPVAPPSEVWDRIAHRTEFLRRGRAWARTVAWHTLPRPGWRQVLGGAGVAFALALLLWLTPFTRTPTWIGVTGDPNAQMAWAINVSRDAAGNTVLTARPGNPDAAAAAAVGRAAELWLIAGDAPPRSLGLLDKRGSRSVFLPPRLRGTVALAVSLEPPGGSPTGAPIGPVVYQGRLQAI
ncbi:MAG: hypothetical protein FJX64_08430, partial [Alphaproteobacteria bacterium]|nr:hypothetical protein [Alphaproteobacteria bacterium]